jgi:hypothetical protein
MARRRAPGSKNWPRDLDEVTSELMALCESLDNVAHVDLDDPASNGPSANWRGFQVIFADGREYHIDVEES